MKKILTLFLIFALCLSLVIGLVACNKECDNHLDEDGNSRCDVCGEELQINDEQNTNNSNDNAGDDNNQGDDDNQINVVVVPKAEYERETIEGVTYIYYGTLPQEAVDLQLNEVLSNLVSNEGQLVAGANGYYTYDNKEYACLVGAKENENVRLSNGLEIKEGGLYFFKVQKIKWRVLEENNGRAVLLCDNVIAEHCFNATGTYNQSLGTLIGTPYSANDYAPSALRNYLNNTLINEIFSLRERQSIYENTVLNRPGESAFMLTQGMDTSSIDKMYVPSYWEINTKYDLKKEESKVGGVEVKDYQVAKGFTVKEIAGHYYSSWWLRTSGKHINEGNVVHYDGTIGTASSCSVNLDAVVGIRPVITIRTV